MMLFVILGCGLGDRLSGAGGAFLDAPLKAPENDAALVGGLASDALPGDLGLSAVFFGDIGGVRALVAMVSGLAGLLLTERIEELSAVATTLSSSLFEACMLLADCGVAGKTEEEALLRS